MTTLAGPVVLEPDEPVKRHAFAHPDHIAGDRAVLGMLARDLTVRLAGLVAHDEPLISYIPNRDEWHRRVVVPRPDELDRCERLTVVGFFGRVRDQIDPEVEYRIKALGEELVDAVVDTPGVLGYSTHLLADERNYANLVLLRNPEVIEQWRTRDPHPTAAEVWSPHYYAHVRIYRGRVERRSMDREGSIRLESAKYWDFRSDPVWRAVRRLA